MVIRVMIPQEQGIAFRNGGSGKIDRMTRSFVGGVAQDAGVGDILVCRNGI